VSKRRLEGRETEPAECRGGVMILVCVKLNICLATWENARLKKGGVAGGEMVVVRRKKRYVDGRLGEEWGLGPRKVERETITQMTTRTELSNE